MLPWKCHWLEKEPIEILFPSFIKIKSPSFQAKCFENIVFFLLANHDVMAKDCGPEMVVFVRDD